MKINRKDTLDFKEKILRLTPQDRKKIGINKSTLWYMKQNMMDGKSVKIYDKILSKLKEMNN